MLGHNTNADAIENEATEPETSGLKNVGRLAVGENSASQDQFIGKKIAYKIRKQVDNSVMTVEN